MPKSYTWEEFVAKLQTPVRTNETSEDFKKLGKQDRDRLKDVGGFVGGVLKDRARKKGNVQWRTLLTLDADSATLNMRDKFKALGLKGLIYSTRSHTPEAPRLRLVIPTASNVPTEDYPALINYFAVLLGVEQFDPTTDEIHRLMYWPSCSSDGDYIFQDFDGVFLDTEELLQAKPEWRNAAMWELSARKHKDRVGGTGKMQDPTTKRGLIGAFCRLYDIHSAIEEFLPGVYEPTENGRYTFVGGSTVNGVVTYDDLYLYSHHSTDPAQGREVNAWDLVRIHLHGALDVEVSEDTPVNKLPSYLEMCERVRNIPEVVMEIATEDAGVFDDGFQEEDRTWRMQLEVSKSGNLVESIRNCRIILMNDPRLKGKIRYNELADRVVADSSLPWRGGLDMSWSDSDMSRLYLYFEERYHLSNRSNISTAWSGIMFDYRFHPVREYLNGLVWDGVPRVERMLAEYLGAEDDLYTREVTRKWMVAAIARAMEPGCKFDYMLLLVGAQGIGKSSFLQRLAGAEWFTDSLDNMGGGAAAAEQLKGYWLVCVDELSALKKIGEAHEAVKNFLSRTADSFRPAYGHYVLDSPRQCVFCGTTNEATFLRDATGGRRFWPVQVRTKNPLIWEGDFPRDQLWAEAMAHYMLGEDLFVANEIEELARSVQEHYTEVDDQVGRIVEFIAKLIPDGYYDMTPAQRHMWHTEGEAPTSSPGVHRREYISSYEIYCEMMGGSENEFPRKKQYEINNCLRSVPTISREGRMSRIPYYGKQRIYKILDI